MRLSSSGPFREAVHISTMNFKSAEFTFISRNAEGEAARYSVVVTQGLTTMFIRTGSRLRPFSVLVPRLDEDRYTGIGAEALARCAIGLALRDGLFDRHPDEPVYLEGDVPQWSGNLTANISPRPKGLCVTHLS
jgi:hypothetical protein